MKRTTLPRTTLEVSKVGLGTASLHRLWGTEKRQILDTALDSGITHIDTARLYGNGTVEATIGNYLSSSSTRSALSIATKVGFELSAAQQVYPLTSKVISKIVGLSQQHANHSVRACESSFNASLKALRSDWVDILFVHEPLLASSSCLEKLIPWLRKQKKEGKARYIGLAGDGLRTSSLLLGSGSEFDVIQTNWEGWANGVPSAYQPQIHYGVFRGKSNNEDFRNTWDHLREQRFDGMILYSTHKPERLRQLGSNCD